MGAICNTCRGKGRTLEAGAGVNAPASEERTPLWVAVYRRRYHLAKALINGGADVNASGWLRYPVLLEAADFPENDAEKFIRLLINSGANVNITGKDGSTALMRAARRAKSPAVITALIDAGADVNMTNNEAFKSTALMIAISSTKSPAVITALIDAGADVNMRDLSGRSAFTLAALTHFDKCLQLLIEAADKTDPARSYLPPLSDIEFNSYNLQMSTIKLLLRAGIKFNVLNPYHNNTLTYYIVECKRNFDQVNKDICMLLFAAGERVTGPVVKGIRRYDHDILTAQVPEYLLHKDLQMCLKHLCREAIRNHLLEVDPHTHLFGRVPRLGLPKSLTEYLLYNVSL